MHPILARKERLIVYLLAWIPVGAMFASTLRFFGDWPSGAATALGLPMAIVLAFLCLAVWPLCRAMPLGRGHWVRLIGAHAGSVVIMSGLWIFIGRVLAAALDDGGYFPGVNALFERATPVMLVIGMLVLVLSIAVHYLLTAFERAREAERTALEVEVQAREAELKALKAQINPHFLFNSLNSISALAGKDPAGARRMAILLSDFLRRSMKLGAHEQIALADELQLASDYLDIEQIRFGERLEIERDIEPEALACQVPALMLQPILENAIKHGIAHTIEGGTLRIEARRSGGRLNICIENPCDPERPSGRGHGLGIPNVRSRLANFHPAASHVLAREQEGHFTIEISLPAVEGATISKVETAQAAAAARAAQMPNDAGTVAADTKTLHPGAEPHGA